MIPQDNLQRDIIVAQLQTATVSEAAEVVEEHTLKYGTSREVRGRGSNGSFAAKDEKDGLKLFLPENNLFSEYPLFQLVEYLAEKCCITNPQHVQLLYTCLSHSTLTEIQSKFDRLGLHVGILDQGR